MMLGESSAVVVEMVKVVVLEGCGRAGSGRNSSLAIVSGSARDLITSTRLK